MQVCFMIETRSEMTVPRWLCTDIRKNVLIITTILSDPPSPLFSLYVFLLTCCHHHGFTTEEQTLTITATILASQQSIHSMSNTLPWPCHPSTRPLCHAKTNSTHYVFQTDCHCPYCYSTSTDNESVCLVIRDAPAVTPCYSAPWLPNGMILLIKLIISSIGSSCCVCIH